MKLLKTTLFVAALATSVSAFAHGDAPHGASGKKTISTEEKAFGREGDPTKVSRTVKVEMSDGMRFTPSALQVRSGETIRFEVTNAGKIQHELVLGTMDELKAHAELMRKNPGMEHDEPYMAHVAPGKTESIVWTFTKTGNFYFACLVAGHFEAGMVGNLAVR